jgi:hypothetical protein
MTLTRILFLFPLMLLNGCAGSQPSLPEADPQFDWSLSQTVRSPDGIVDAVVEIGVPKAAARTLPLRRISVQTVDSPDAWGHHWSVWESQVGELPSVVWAQPRRLVITQHPHLVLAYEPEVTIGNRNYAVDLAITRDN